MRTFEYTRFTGAAALLDKAVQELSRIEIIADSVLLTPGVKPIPTEHVDRLIAALDKTRELIRDASSQIEDVTSIIADMRNGTLLTTT